MRYAHAINQSLGIATLLTNVLIDGGFAGHAAAQTTPATYCASLGNPSCEVLNVEPVGIDSQSYQYYLVKLCHNGRFETRSVTDLSTAGQGAIIAKTALNASGTLDSYPVALSWATYGPTFSGSTNIGGFAAINFAGGCF